MDLKFYYEFTPEESIRFISYSHFTKEIRLGGYYYITDELRDIFTRLNIDDYDLIENGTTIVFRCEEHLFAFLLYID